MNNKGTTLLIVILSILVIVAGGMLIYKIINEKEESENVVADDNVDINEDKDDKELVVEEKKPQIFNGNDRPIAVMIDNHSGAWPQANLNKAYLVYEIIVEGGETRLMAVFKGQDLEKIGPIRSSRHYFLDYALENDAIYVHHGWSPQAQNDISALNVNNINGIQESSNNFWRVKDKKSPHNMFTSTPSILKIAERKGYATISDKKSVLNYIASDVDLKEKYGINEENIQKARKIMTVRYEISRNGYSNIKPVIISKSISYLSANQIKEQSSSFPGTSVVTTPIVTYPYGSLASHILGYVGSISSEEYNANKEKYDINDIIGKTGIQYTLEEYLKGEDGIRQVDMSVDGTITEQHIAEEAEAGHTVTLTIDSNLQKVTEEALKKNIKDIANGSYGQKYNAKAGAAVVMDVKSGEILALASYPDYEPELFISGITQKKLEEYNKGNNYYNRAISGTYAPRFSI